MAENTTINTIITMIIIILVLVIAVFGIMYLNGAKTIKEFFPDFNKKNLTTSYNEEFFLENPSYVYFEIVGDDANIFFRYFIEKLAEKSSWTWYKDFSSFSLNPFNWFRKEPKSFLNVIVTNTAVFKGLDKKNKDFVILLQNKSVEQGLREIVNRVLKNEEGNEIQEVKLNVYVGQIENPSFV